MPFLEAVRLALQTIRVQKLKSFFTLMGVMIGVTFLIAVVSIVGGMSRYMTDQVVGKVREYRAAVMVNACRLIDTPTHRAEVTGAAVVPFPRHPKA